MEIVGVEPTPPACKAGALANSQRRLKSASAKGGLYLPDKKELQDKLQQWIQEFDKEEDL